MKASWEHEESALRRSFLALATGSSSDRGPRPSSDPPVPSSGHCGEAPQPLLCSALLGCSPGSAAAEHAVRDRGNAASGTRDARVPPGGAAHSARLSPHCGSYFGGCKAFRPLVHSDRCSSPVPQGTPAACSPGGSVRFTARGVSAGSAQLDSRSHSGRLARLTPTGPPRHLGAGHPLCGPRGEETVLQPQAVRRGGTLHLLCCWLGQQLT